MIRCSSQYKSNLAPKTLKTSRRWDNKGQCGVIWAQLCPLAPAPGTTVCVGGMESERHP